MYTFPRLSKASFLAVFILATAVATLPVRASEEPRESDEVEDLLALGATAPPCFEAHAILVLLERGQIRSAARRKALAAWAFELAASADERSPRAFAEGSSLEFREGFRVVGLETPIDGLSLQCRAVDALFADDPGAARELFWRIDLRSAIVPPTCPGETVADPALYYDALARLIDRGISKKERSDGLDILFVERAIGDLSRPEQLPGLARLLGRIDVAADARQRLISEFAAALSRIEPDGAALELTLSWRSRRTPVIELAAGLPERVQRSYGASLARLLSNCLHATRCPTRAMNERAEAIRAAFTEAFPKSELELRDLLPEEFQRANIPVPKRLFSEPAADRVLDGLRTLRYEQREIADGDQAAEARFAEKYFAYTDVVAAWNSSESRDLESFLAERIVVEIMLIDIAPTDDARLDAARRSVALLAAANPRLVSSAEWWAHLKTVRQRVPPSLDESLRAILEAAHDSRVEIFTRLNGLAEQAPTKGVKAKPDAEPVEPPRN